MRSFISRLILLSVCFLSLLWSTPPPVALNAKKGKVEHFTMEYYLGSIKDPHMIKEVFKNKTEIKPVSNALALGYDPREHWFHLILHNNTQENLNYILQFTEQFQHHVDLVTFSPYYHLEKNGISIPVEQRQIQSAYPAFRLRLRPDERKDLYLKIQSPLRIFGAFHLKDPIQFLQDTHYRNELYYFYFGGMLSLALYNLFIYFSLRKKVYLYYVGYVTLFTFWAALQKGYFTPYLSPALFDMMLVSIPLYFIFLILFSQKILQTEKTFPRIHTILKGFILISLIISVAMIVDIQRGVLLLNVMALILLPILLIISAIAAYRNRSIAKIYMSAMLIFIIGMSTISLMAMGVFEYSTALSSIPILASFFEAILFSLLLAYRINRLNIEANHAKAALIKQKKNEKSRLFQEVAEKTKALNRAKKQLEAELKERRKLEAHLKEQANTDAMTKLLNRRAFMEAFMRELARFKRTDDPLTYMILDIDYFKRINDTYGHHIGDLVIKSIAENMRQHTRSIDHIGRIGGEEFAVLMPDTVLKNGYKIADRLRDFVSKYKMRFNHLSIGVTVSIGITDIHNQNENIQNVMQRADAALYNAKREGRNRVCSL
jgi:diguanylate cyclase (GGDEF)-like protein